MSPFENAVAEDVWNTNHHDLYRETPVFSVNNLMADGVLMEAYSIEDLGKGMDFCVFVYIIQLGIEIGYLTGESRQK